MRWTLALIGLAAPLAVAVPGAAAPHDAARTVVTVQGESPIATNIPTAQDPRASGGAYLALDVVRRAPAGGWYATYGVDVSRPGIYRLDAVLTTPAMPDRTPFGGSPFNLSVNGSAFAQVAKSEPVWASHRRAPRAWGSLVDTTVDDVELRRGSNTITLMVDERRISASPQLDHPPGRPTPPRYRFFLDTLTLIRTPLALDSVHLGDPRTNLGTYREDGDAALHVSLNGRASTGQSVRYRIADYDGDRVGAGTVVVASGSSQAAVRVPADLPPGNYRMTARLTSAPEDPVVGNFARLPDQQPVRGAENRFGVTTSAPWLVPSSRLHAFAAALHEMGAGYVREEISWPLVEPRRGAFHIDGLNRIARVFHRHGLHTLGALWNLAGTGEAQAPRWAMSPASRPLPADLRAAYRLGRRLAAQTDGIGRDAVELWNEPDIDIVRQWYSRTSGDQYAAFVKAAALGVAAGPGRPLVSLPGIAFPGPFQDVMLQNDVSRYADVWSFHGYAGDNPADPITLPTEPRVENRLRRAYGADVQTWMTEAGIFLDPQSPEHGLSRQQQVQQARYLVQSTVDALAAGNDKQFWFSAAPYGGFGLLNNEFQPWPSYSAYAAMASVLGEADFAGRVRGMPDGVRGYRFDTGGETVTVLWAQQPTRIDVDVPGEVRVDDIMGAQVRVAPAVDGSVRVWARRDPIYLVADGGLDHPTADRVARRPDPTSAAERIVLSQRFPATARPVPLPFGYRLEPHSRMTVSVYNFNDTAQRVTLQPRTFGGWSIRGSSGARTVAVPAHGQVRVPYRISAGDRVERRVDYPLVVDATVDGRRVPPSVSRIQLGRKGPPGESIRLRPWIFDIAPADGSTVTGPRVRLTALVWDDLSRIAARTVRVEVDGHRVRADYEPRTGRLAARLRLSPGRHHVWIGAFNQAYAPSQAAVTVRVRR